PEADQGAAEEKERLVHVRPPLEADQEAPELMEPGEAALDRPAQASESGAVIGLTPRDERGDPAPTELPAVAVAVVGAVADQPLRAPTRAADPAGEGRNGVHQRQ